MAGKANTERINELSEQGANLNARLDALREEVKGLGDEQSKATDLLSELKTAAALLKRECDDLRSWKDQRGRNLWMLVPSVVAAILSSGLTALATYLLRK